MSLYSSHILYPPNQKIPNGYIPREVKNKIAFLDVTPSKSPYTRSARNQVQPNPIINNLINVEISKDVVYENIKPVLIILRIMGVLPITRTKVANTQFILASPAMVYSLLLHLFLLSYVFYMSYHGVETMKSAEGKFEEAVIAYLFTVYLFPLIVMPIMWYETRKIAEILNGWVDFELAYLKLSNRPLPLKMRSKATIVAIVIPILSTTSVFITHFTMVNFRLLTVLPYVFLEILTYVLGGYWYLLCETLSECANVLAEDFQQALRHIGPAGRVAEYRALWLRLSKLARHTGIANCYTFVFVTLYLFLIITLSIYGLLSQISEGFGTKDIGLAVTACCSVCLLFVISDEAHYASHNVRTNFQKKLLMVELSWMNTDAQTEVSMFLRATDLNPSQISLGGFFDVNRNLFKSMLATMVTYLVVLLQFQISIPEENDTPKRENTTVISLVGNVSSTTPMSN